MNEKINNLRIEAGISRLQDDPRLVVVNREGNIIDALIGLEKFAELIVRECAHVALMSNGNNYHVMSLIMERFGMKNEHSN